MKIRVPETWRIDATAIAIMVVATVGALLALKPMLSRSADESRALLSLPDERRAASDLARQFAQEQAELRTVKRLLESYGQPCWTDTDRSRRIEGLYTAAREAGLKVDGIEPGTPEAITGRRALALRMTGRGTFASVVSTFSVIRGANPDMVTRGLDLSPLANSDDEIHVMAEILWVLPAETPEATASVK